MLEKEKIFNFYGWKFLFISRSLLKGKIFEKKINPLKTKVCVDNSCVCKEGE